MMTLDLFLLNSPFFYCITPLYDFPSRSTPTLHASMERAEADRLSAVQDLPARYGANLASKEMRRLLLSPFVALLCNKSLATGCFPAGFKSAVTRPLVVCRCRYLMSVSVFGIFVGIFYVGSVFGIGILKYRDIGIRYFAIIYIFGVTRPQQCCGQLSFYSCARAISCEPSNAGRRVK